MKNIENYKRRFYTLMETTMGDVRPLISEQTPGTTQPIAAGGGGAATKTVKINGVDVPTHDDSTGKNATYSKLLLQAYNRSKIGSETIKQISKNGDGVVLVYVSDAKLNDYENSVKDPLGWSYSVDCEKLDGLTELPGGGSTRGWGKRKSLNGLKTANHDIKLDDASKLMLKRYCIAYFPKMELSYRAATPLYDN
jgi:hypothetical protein